jgi:hypothetical protein
MDWPAPPAHLIFMLYTFISILTLSLVANAHSFKCIS